MKMTTEMMKTSKMKTTSKMKIVEVTHKAKKLCFKEVSGVH